MAVATLFVSKFYCSGSSSLLDTDFASGILLPIFYFLKFCGISSSYFLHITLLFSVYVCMDDFMVWPLWSENGFSVPFSHAAIRIFLLYFDFPTPFADFELTLVFLSLVISPVACGFQAHLDIFSHLETLLTSPNLGMIYDSPCLQLLEESKHHPSLNMFNIFPLFSLFVFSFRV